MEVYVGERPKGLFVFSFVRIIFPIHICMKDTDKRRNQ